MLASWEIIKDLGNRRLRMVICARHPAQVRRVILTASSRVKESTLLGIMGEVQVADRRPQLQLVAIIVGCIVASVWVVAVEVCNVFCKSVVGVQGE